jgi:alkylation response protein AidB-like acyl-CoA dehydrogenase
MDTAFSSEDLKFQSEVREFISNNYPKELKNSIGTKRKTGKELSRDDLMTWHKILGKHNGWSAPGWPKEHGGAEFSPTQKYIFEQECARAECQYIMPFGVNMVGPVIYTFGNDEQKAKHLPGILSGDVFWCQGYSEPGSGSDLASLKTSAVKEGDHYIVNGQKTWTTLAQHADWIFLPSKNKPRCRKTSTGNLISFD